ncbi:PREDICTED: uncharacterized protein LOC107188823 [Dufourea novaeangliae]|uniref:uncharacterized protein LOC107188823 n=1 Tax=Dufourea novaeangliae TaxID=178035 RepID=UPI000766E7D2|nr:PREDICTED: uncharacterized protein LOC107188823 [Dufourea novaeangliae]
MLTSSVLSIFLWSISLAEWVDMPEFSDEKKIYRISSPRQDHFYTLSQKPAENQFPYVYESIPGKDFSEQTAVNGSGGFVTHQLEDSDNGATIHENASEENLFLTSTDEHKDTTDSSTVDEKDTTTEYYNDSVISNNMDILKYLPVNVFKNVHRTLKSQPTSTEGKLLFLKTFEKTLITEIERRFAQSITVSREKRGADHYDHSYDSHEHATGFPSIEGALMAISFLTFAVYLVRLVMLLFRNMNNSTATTTGATLLLGRRKKSINGFDEDTARILNGMEKFSYNL